MKKRVSQNFTFILILLIHQKLYRKNVIKQIYFLHRNLFNQTEQFQTFSETTSRMGEKFEIGEDKLIKENGLGLVTATFFLAGTMAGSGVLALPLAMVKTGQCEFFFI